MSKTTFCDGRSPILVFDIETRGFNPRTPADIHSLVIVDWEAMRVSPETCMASYADQPGYPPIIEGVARLWDAANNGGALVAHSGLRFDIPRLEKVYPGVTFPRDAIHDTLVAAQLLWPDTSDLDAELPEGLRASHKLAAWGHRLGTHKGDFGLTTDWANWSSAMQRYCEADVLVTCDLYAHILDQTEAAAHVE